MQPLRTPFAAGVACCLPSWFMHKVHPEGEVTWSYWIHDVLEIRKSRPRSQKNNFFWGRNCVPRVARLDVSIVAASVVEKFQFLIWIKCSCPHKHSTKRKHVTVRIWVCRADLSSGVLIFVVGFSEFTVIENATLVEVELSGTVPPNFVSQIMWAIQGLNWIWLIYYLSQCIRAGESLRNQNWFLNHIEWSQYKK